jgi:hypothetical protein
MQPKVSVIIPCYNQAVFLPKAVASLQAQTMPEWECIIVDDGSIDNTAEVANNIAIKDSRVRLIQQANGGSAGARDAGLQAAKGLFIQFLDADDTITPEKLERQVAQMERKKLDISYTAFCAEEKGVRTRVRSVRLNRHKLLVQWGLGASVPIHSFMYRAEFVRHHSISFKDLCKVNEDWEWHIACFLQQPKHAIISDYCGAVYFQNELGKTGNYIKMQEANFEFMTYMTDKLSGWNKCLWHFRISEELWIWLLRMLKYRSTKIAKDILLLPITTTALAILLLPISVWWVAAYFLKTYIAK